MKRKIIEIDEQKCNGCGLCVPNCAEGALRIIDGKARLISDLFCDGLGACLGYCPEGAITVIEREAEPYSEKKVMEYIVKGGMNVIKAHLNHLKDHNEMGYFSEAMEFLKENGISLSDENPPEQKQCGCGGGGHHHPEETKPEHHHQHGSGCPGSREREIERNEYMEDEEAASSKEIPSQLRQWPVQLHLLNPMAGYLQGADLLLAADCTAYALGDFHTRFLSGKSLAIACPKLDTNKEVYVEKIRRMIDEAGVSSIKVLIMEVPCCRGLVSLVQAALNECEKEIPVSVTVVGIDGTLRN